MREFFDKLQRLDRRIIYVFMIVAVVIPFFIPLGLPVVPTQYSRNLFEAIDKQAETGRPILFGMDFDPGTKGELYPMAKAIIAHCFVREIPLIGCTFLPNGPILAVELLDSLSARYDREYGTDFCFFGFQPGAAAVIMNMGEEIHGKAYQVDYKGTPIGELPIMQDVHTYQDIGLVIDVSGTSIPETWIAYAVARYGAKFGMGVTAVMSSDFTPYLQTGQSVGMLNGLAGAAEYERMMLDKGYVSEGEVVDASKKMDSQSAAHLVMIFFILLGNIGYFLSRREQS